MIHYITTEGIAHVWIASELRELQRADIPFVLHAMRDPSVSFYSSDWAGDLDRRTKVIYPLVPMRFAESILMAPILFGKHFFAGLVNALFGKRESFRKRVTALAHLFVACHWARELRGEDVDHIHSQWIHSCGTIGMYSAWLLDVPFSFTGHAVDLFRDRVALHDKIQRAAFIVCISEFHRSLYLKWGARPEQLHTVYCGIDVGDFDRRCPPHVARPRICSLGRLVEKKGFDVLIDACHLLVERGVDFECLIAGSGPLEQQLRDQVSRLQLRQTVQITGRSVLQEEISTLFSNCHIYAQPCVWSKDNDVDGTPRTLMEAMACGLPSVSTELAGIPDIIEHDVSGLLVEAGNSKQLADALQSLIDDRDLVKRLSLAGRHRIEEKFDLCQCIDPLIKLFRGCLGMDPVVSKALVA